MKFKELKINDIIYSFNMGDMNYNKFRVINNTQPRIDLKVPDSTVVDVTLDNNSILVFKSEDISGECNNIFYTTDIENLINRIKSVNNSIQMKLDEIDKLKSNKKLCEKLLTDLDPEVKERLKSEKRLSDVETRMNTLNSDLNEIKQYLKELLDKKK